MSVTASDIARAVGAELTGPGDRIVERVETTDRADKHSLVFIRNEAFIDRIMESAAGAVLIDRQTTLDKPDAAILRVDNVDLALNTVLEMLAPPGAKPEPGIHPSAVVDHSAKIGIGVHLGPHCVVGANAFIGDDTALLAQVYVGNNASIGRGCTFHPGVRFLERCSCGDGCVIHANSVVGADGFGYIPAPDGQGLLKIPQIGAVEIGHGVEIGAGTCIDRAKFGATRIGDGTKIDNLVQIAHNVQIGRACVICAQVGLSGSVRIGDGCLLGGQVGVGDNFVVANGVRLAGGSGVMGNISEPGDYIGTPARAGREAAAGMTLVHKLPHLKARIRALEKALAQQGIELKKPRT